MKQKIIKVLSIEDDPFIRTYIKDIFWVHGAQNNFEFNSVGNLKDARDVINNEKTSPDLLFLDIMLPSEEGGSLDKEGGFKFLEEIKSNPKTKHIKVMTFSGFDDNEIKERALELGADRFLLKGEYLPKELINEAKEVILGK